MRIPPIYKTKSFQLLFVGMTLGAIISWVIFLYIYGTWQERFSIEIKQQHEEILQLKQEKQIWQDEFSKMNELNKKNLTVQSIKVKIENAAKFKIDALTVFEMEEIIKKDLSPLVGKDMDSINNDRKLIKNLIENKILSANEKRFKLEIKELYVYTELKIYLQLKLE